MRRGWLGVLRAQGAAVNRRHGAEAGAVRLPKHGGEGDGSSPPHQFVVPGCGPLRELETRRRHRTKLAMIPSHQVAQSGVFDARTVRRWRVREATIRSVCRASRTYTPCSPNQFMAVASRLWVLASVQCRTLDFTRRSGQLDTLSRVSLKMLVSVFETEVKACCSSPKACGPRACGWTGEIEAPRTARICHVDVSVQVETEGRRCTLGSLTALPARFRTLR